jgi:hypothetical protein
MQGRDLGFGNRWVREGIVAQSTIRFAAGASVVAASLLVAGPNPAQAVADKHGSGSHNTYNDRNGGAISRSSIGKIGVLGGSDNSPSIESDGGGLEDLAVAQSASGGAVALRSAALAEQPTGINATGAVAAARAAGSDYSAPSIRGLRSPRVVFGNGRSPGDPVPGVPEVLRDDSLEAPVADAAPAVPEAVEIDIPPLPPPSPPTEHIKAAVVVGELGIGTIDTSTDPLAGVAGLILIPAVGAVLGYRQARAAQSIRESSHKESART